MAFLHANCHLNEVIAMRYPKDLIQYDDEGNELMAILRKNTYGMPQASRRYCQMRDHFILDFFNKAGWGCKQCVQDPSLFIIIDLRGGRIYLLIHTDDCDMVGDNLDQMKLVAKAFHEEYEIKICPPNFMLGVSRELSSCGNFMEFTQIGYVEALYEQFSGFIKSRLVPTCPFPPLKILSLAKQEYSEKESRAVLKDDYLGLVGSLLWAARNCFPECSSGVNQLGRVVSRPTREAFDAGIKMVQYLFAQRHRGIRFCKLGNQILRFYYDSSNNEDGTDSMAQHGHVGLWMGGPITWLSTKHKHVGLSASHNEYMALGICCRNVVWLRYLFEEMQIFSAIEGATIVQGDNDTVTLLSRENMVTLGNRFIRKEYHFSKECVDDGFVSTREVRSIGNYSDLMTKPSTKQEVLALRPHLTGYSAVPLPEAPEPPKD